MKRQYGDREGSIAATVKNMIVSYLEDPENQPVRIQQLMQHLSSKLSQEEVPTERAVAVFWKNHNSRSGASVARAPQSLCAWTIADFVAASRELPVFAPDGADMSLVRFSSDPAVQFVVASPRMFRNLAADNVQQTACSVCCTVPFRAPSQPVFSLLKEFCLKWVNIGPVQTRICSFILQAWFAHTRQFCTNA